MPPFHAPLDPQRRHDAAPPKGTPLFFTDAFYKANGAAFCGTDTLNRTFFMRWKIPGKFACNQQIAELYAFVHAFRWIARRYMSFTLVADSTSALHSALSLN